MNQKPIYPLQTEQMGNPCDSMAMGGDAMVLTADYDGEREEDIAAKEKWQRYGFL